MSSELQFKLILIIQALLLSSLLIAGYVVTSKVSGLIEEVRVIKSNNYDGENDE